MRAEATTDALMEPHEYGTAEWLAQIRANGWTILNSTLDGRRAERRRIYAEELEHIRTNPGALERWHADMAEHRKRA